MKGNDMTKQVAKTQPTTLPQAQKAQPTQALTVADLLQQNREAIAAALPQSVKFDRFVRVALNAIARNPQLQQCSATSLYAAIMQSAQLGLEIGLLNQAHLVPYYNKEKRCYEAQFQIGYLGMRDLARRHGDIIDGDAQAVRAKDEFDYALGDNPYVQHKPSLDQDRGEIVAFYAWAQPKHGKIKVAVMTAAEIERHRDKFSMAANGTAWAKHFEAMGLKTVLRRCYKFLARSPQLREAIALDELQESHVPQQLDAEMEQEAMRAARQANANQLQAIRSAQIAQSESLTQDQPAAQAREGAASENPPSEPSAQSPDVSESPAPPLAGDAPSPLDDIILAIRDSDEVQINKLLTEFVRSKPTREQLQVVNAEVVARRKQLRSARQS